MRTWRLGLCLLTALVLQGGVQRLVCAQTEPEAAKKDTEKKEAAPVDPTGTWKWEFELGENTSEFQVKLNWDGKKLSGKYTAFDNTTDIEEGKLEKDQLSFSTKREFNGNEFVVKFKGAAKPDEINGTVSLDFNEQPQEFEWNAKRSVELDDVVGVWDLKVETANGLVEPKLTITKDGEKLKGKSASPVFGEREAKNLQLKDNVLSWEIEGSNSGANFHIKYSGRPRGNTIEGKNEFMVEGANGGSMTFSGKRTPPDEKVKERAAAGDAKPAATEGAEK